MTYELAQVNIGRLLAPIDDPRTAGFVAALDPINAVADEAPGFIWRLQTEDGNATAIRAFEWDAADSAGVIMNMSVWQDVEHLSAFIYGGPHREVMRQRRAWFQQITEAYTACWWVPAGQRPTPADAEDRIRHLRAHGPTPYAFTLRTSFGPPDTTDADRPVTGSTDWLCPA